MSPGKRVLLSDDPWEARKRLCGGKGKFEIQFRGIGQGTGVGGHVSGGLCGWLGQLGLYSVLAVSRFDGFKETVQSVFSSAVATPAKPSVQIWCSCLRPKIARSRALHCPSLRVITFHGRVGDVCT